METSHIFFGDPWLLQVSSVIKMNKTNLADLNEFSKFHSLYCFVVNVLMLAKSFEKKWKVSRRWKVRGFYGSLTNGSSSRYF
jgi:hypothetical protein